jgi:4-hydroxy-2-oxoheptanedioate aldolase
MMLASSLTLTRTPDRLTETGMDLPKNPFKQAIHSGAVPVGTWHTLGSTAVVEALGHAGFDFLVLDMEHGQIDLPQTVDLLRVMAGTRAAPVVRLPWNDMVVVKRVLDAGAQTVMLPFIQNADEARAAVAYTRYPPEGVRGVASIYRGGGYGLIPDYCQHAASELCVILQIETLEALEQLAEIAAVPGVDSIFIGPADLSASMGYLGHADHPAVREKLAQGARECRRLGKPCGIIGFSTEAAVDYLSYGYSWIAVSTDVTMMLKSAAETLATVRASAAASANAGARNAKLVQ